MNTEEICAPSVNLSSVNTNPSHYPTIFKNIGQLLALSSQRGPLQTVFISCICKCYLHPTIHGNSESKQPQKCY